MKKSISRKILVFTLVCAMLAISAVSSYAANDYMAYNIYSDPDLSKTSNTFTTFTIDFRGVQTPKITYWALCNFGLYFSPEAKAEYPGITGGGAYAGLQDNDDNEDGRKAIMAFWEMFYTKKGVKENLRAQRVYPKGAQNNFGGEGEGTNHITKYVWEDMTWYRMVLHSWTDKETGRTFVGQWFQNLKTGEWTLISYFNSQLTNSCLRGGLSLFQENFVGGVNQFVEREFHVKNIYALDHKDNEWKSLNKTTLSYGNGGAANKEGGHSFGATDEYFWGIGGGDTDGLTQDQYEAISKKSGVYTITQPDTPTFGEIKAPEVQVKKVGKVWSVVWTQNKLSTPQLGVKFEIIDVDNNVIATHEETRPELRLVKFPDVSTDIFKCRMTITDIFGNTMVLEQGTKEYNGLLAEPTVTPAETLEEESSSVNYVVPAIIGCVAGVVVIGGGVAALVVVNAKKKKKVK